MEERTLGKDHSDTLVSKAMPDQVLTQEGHYPEAERVPREDYDSYLHAFRLDQEDPAAAAYDLATP